MHMDGHAAAEERRVSASRHIAKRTRRDRAVEAVFDEAARKEFLTGFGKRKKQRRKAAEHQVAEKARKSRLESRKQACRASASFGHGVLTLSWQKRDELNKVLQSYEATADAVPVAAPPLPVPAASRYANVEVVVEPMEVTTAATRRRRKTAT